MKILFIAVSLAILASSCRKAELEIEHITDSEFVETYEYTLINDDEVTLKARLISPDASEHGFVMTNNGTSPFITGSGSNKISVGTSLDINGNYEGYLEAFLPNVVYAIRAYTIINGQVYYGKTVRYETGSRGSWKKLADFPGPLRKFPVSFSANGRGYVGCGSGPTGNLNDMWEFDPATNTWTQIPNYPGEPMNSGFSFVIGNKAYVGGGTYESSPPYEIYGGYRSFYEFDVTTRQWTKLEDFPALELNYSPGLFGAFAFTVGGYGFVGGGGVNGQTWNIGIFRFDPATKKWEEYSLLPKNHKNEIINFHYGASFVIGNTAYIGTGFAERNFGEKPNHFYSWNYQTKEWKLLNTFPGIGTAFALAASGNNSGFMGMGDHSNSWWQYESTSILPQWKPASPNPDSYGTSGGMCFTIDNKTYIGLGQPILSAHGWNVVYEYTHPD